MSDHLGKGYKDSGYTVVFVILHWPNCIILVLNLPLMVELWALFCLLSVAIVLVLARAYRVSEGTLGDYCCTALRKAHKFTDCALMITAW